MKKFFLLLLLTVGFANAQNSFIYLKTGEKLTIRDWDVYPNGPNNKFPYYIYDPKLDLTPDQMAFTYGADLMRMKEIDSITGHGVTYKPYTLKGERYIFLGAVVAKSPDYTLLLGYHRRGTLLDSRSFNFKFVDNKTNKVVEDYIYKDYAGESEMKQQEAVFATANKYFGTCDDFMSALEDCRKSANNPKKYEDRFRFSFLYKSFNCK